MSLQLKQIELKELWEDFLLTYSPQALFQSWLWGEVQKQSGQTVFRYGIYDNTSLIGIAQICVVRARRGTYLQLRHGPVWKLQKKSYWQEALVLFTDLVRKSNAWFLRVSPLIENSFGNRDLYLSLGLKPAPIHEVDAERCWILDIDVSEDELLANMRKTTRYEIRRGIKTGVKVEVTKDSKKLKDFFSLYKETSKRQGFVVHSSIKEEFEVFAKEDKAELFLGFDQDRCIAGAIILFYGNQAIYHHGASLISKVPASYVIQWKAILESKKRGIKVYNFYGIAPDDKPNHPWRGITLFKKGFGGREINFLHSHDYPVSPLYIIPKTIETIRTKIRGY